MIAAVFDANSLASGFAGARVPESTPGELLRRSQREAFELVSPDHLLRELTTTLRQDYFRRRLSPPQQSRAAALVRYKATLVAITAHVAGVATHAEDDLVLATAVSAKADYLVTGDRKLLALASYEGVHTVSPRQFLAILEAEAQDAGDR